MTKNGRKKQVFNTIKTFVIYIAIGLFVSVGIKMLIEPVVVVGNSMNPSLEDGQYMINDRFFYNVEKAKHGDVVIITDDLNRHLIKRVVGVPNDRITIRNNELFVNGVKAEEPYLKEPMSNERDLTIELDDDEIFVLGDNRNNSVDSRDLGAIKAEKVRGKVLFRVKPFDQSYQY